MRSTPATAETDPYFARPVAIEMPAAQTIPLVFASPHSGRDYSPAFLAQTRLDALTLRRSEDSFIDQIFAGVLDCGAPLIHALFPRAYVDPNREPYELDPEMYVESLPPFANTASPLVSVGLGTIPKVVATGNAIYKEKLSVNEAFRRVNGCHLPYHRALAGLIERTRARFGYCIVVDCHSMPSSDLPTWQRASQLAADVVLGDRFGSSCATTVTETAQAVLKRLGYAVIRNVPYAGGFTTRRYGRPENGVHAIQIELSRSLYMDEATVKPRPGIGPLGQNMLTFARALAAIPQDQLLPED
ncbi:MAG: N-formylglutamate amidohydrolase [Alphaproteobacteria bacterium]